MTIKYPDKTMAKDEYYVQLSLHKMTSWLENFPFLKHHSKIQNTFFSLPSVGYHF